MGDCPSTRSPAEDGGTRPGIAEGRSGTRYAAADVTRSFEPHDDPNIDSVWNWFEFQKSLVREELTRVLRAFPPNGDIHAAPPASKSRFIGLTRGEVNEFFAAQIGHLELLTMFDLLATAEAILRREFKNRVAARKRDGLSRRFREIHKAFGDRIRLDEDILAAMKEEGVAPNAIADFRGALRLRHWLAHGRHWHPKLGRGYEPGDVFDIARALIESIPA